MREKDIPISEWQKNFNNGEYNGSDFKTQVKAGWYDWFCKTESLRNKTIRMGRIIKQVKNGGKYDLNTHYVWFKNNCPMVGPLYDDFRFADIESGETQITICIGDKREKHLYSVWCRKNDFEKEYIGFDHSRDLVKWLNTPWEE